MSGFSAEVYQNEFLPPGGTQAHAIITVSSADPATDSDPAGPAAMDPLRSERTFGGSDPASLGSGSLTTGSGSPASGWFGAEPPRPVSVGGPTPAGAGPPELAEIVLLDCSGSMANPPTKMAAARHATNAAVDCLPDGVWFAVVRGTGTTSMIFPSSPILVQASAATRAAELATAVQACRGRFQCDCRGIGADWRVDELRTIATGLLGTVDVVPRPDDLSAEFTRVISSALSRATDRVTLRIWTPVGASVAFLRQVAPDLRDLTGSGRVVDERSTDYPTGAWGIESRDYHVCVTLPAQQTGTELLAAGVGLVVEDRTVSYARVRAVWTTDPALSSRVSTEVAHYTGQAELARVLVDGLEAHKAGDTETATLNLGRGVQIARESGNEATYRLLQKVVHIDDATTGTVRLKNNVEKIDEMVLDSRSTRTVRVNR